jgi:hypothetical protein
VGNGNAPHCARVAQIVIMMNSNKKIIEDQNRATKVKTGGNRQEYHGKTK